MPRSPIAVFAMSLVLAAYASADVVGWRTDGSSRYPAADVPTEWGASKNVKWSVRTETWGNATPVIVGDRFFISQEPNLILCLALRDGKELWRRSAGYADLGEQHAEPRKHNTNGYTSPTVVSDGKVVAAVNGLGVVACWDLDGNKQWMRYIDSPRDAWGHSASPALAGDKLIVHINGNVYALALKDGKELWKGASASRWGSPVTVKVGDDYLVMAPAGDFFRASDGRKIASRVADLNYNVPVIANGVIYYLCGEKGIAAIEMPRSLAGAWTPKVLWKSTVAVKDRTYSSPLIHEGLAYLLNQRGTLFVIDIKDGKTVYQQAMNFGRGTGYPSIVLVGKHILVSYDSGATAVIEPGRAYKEIVRNTLEGFRATPVCAGDAMIVRTIRGVYAIAK